MLSVRANSRRPDLHGLAGLLLEELSEPQLQLLEECLATGFRAVAKDLADERGFPRSVVSCIFVIAVSVSAR